MERWSAAEPSWVKSAAGPSPAVDDPLEREAVGRRHLRRPRTISRREDLRDLLGFEPAVPHGDERPDERPHHLVEERVRARRDLDTVARPARSTTARAAGPSRPTAAAGRTTRSRARRGATRAASRIGATASAPGRCQTNRASNGSGHGPVSIRYRYSRAVAENRALNPSGARRTSHGDDLGREHPVDRPLELLEIDVVLRHERRDLPPSMHPGVRPPGDRELRRTPQDADRARPTGRPRPSAAPRSAPTPGTPSRRTRATSRTITPRSMGHGRNGARGGGRLGRRRASRKHRRSLPSTARRAARGEPPTSARLAHRDPYSDPTSSIRAIGAPSPCRCPSLRIRV